MSTNIGVHETGAGSIWASVRNALAVLMICTLLAGLVTFSMLTLSAKRFEAETLLTLVAETDTAVTRAPRLEQAELNKHLRALTASDLLIGVANTLNLRERAEFNATAGPIDMINQLMRQLGLAKPLGADVAERRMMAAMRSRLAVSSLSKGQGISIRFTSLDPQVATAVANAVATTYRDGLRRSSESKAHDESAAHLPTIEEWHREILAVDAAVKRFRAEANGSIGAGATLNNDARRAGSAAIQRALESAAQTMRDELQRLQRARADKPNIIEANGTLGAAPFVVNAQAPVQAVFVKKVPYTLLAMAATMMLGLAFTAVRGLFAVGGSAARNRTAIDVVAGSGPMMSRAVPAARGADRAGVRKTVPVPVAARMPPVSVSGSHAPVAAGSFSSMSHYALHLIDELPVEGGYRLLITGASEAVDPSDEVIDLVAELSDAGLSVLLVDWSLDGERLHSDIEIGAAASLSDVMSGHAEFDDILVTLPDSNLHYIYSTDARVGGELLNEDDLNLVLDALDEAYDHVIVAGGYNDTRALFEAIQGRFDAGMTIADATIGTAPVNGDSFLGFDVADIEVVQFVRTVDQSGANRQPMDTEGGNVNVRL